MTLITRRIEWEGLPVNQVINSETGEMEIKTIPGPGFIKVNLTLAKTTQVGEINKLEFVNEDNYRRLVNNALKQDGKKELKPEEFREKFWTDGTTKFNIARAEMLNKKGIVTDANRAQMYINNIPLVIDPVTGRQVSSDGKKSTQPITGKDGSSEPAASQVELNSYILEQAKKRGGTQAQLRYPLETPDSPFDYDYISIQAYDYKPSGLGTGNEQFDIDKNIMNQEGTDYGTSYETVILPMQPSLSETNGVNWSDDQLNPIQAMMGDFAAQTITAAGQDFNITSMKDAFNNLGSSINAAMNKKETAAAISAYFAGQAVGANVIGRQTGMVINPNLELLFNGPNLRSFNFNFKLTPRSEPEANMCKKIIRAFKRNMAVSRTEGNLFLLSPKIFKLKYIFKGDGDHPYLNKFKPCALTNFAVDYTPDGSYSTFDNGSMTQFALNMSFSEVMPIYAEDNDDKDDTDLTMGY